MYGSSLLSKRKIFMKIRNLISSAAAVSMVLLCGCSGGNAENVTETSVQSVSEAVSEAPKDPHDEMVGRSLVSLGNDTRIRAKIAQMQSGEETTIAYIGGSITEGFNAGSEDCWAKLSYENIAERFGTGDNVRYVNAGLAGTPSVLGNLRLERDVLSHDADIVFIEFAVNDAQDIMHKASYEDMIRTILTRENEPAVILLFTVLENGYTCQEHMSEIGSYYDLPMISVGDAINPEFEAGRMVWDDYSNDQSHPHKEGHKLVAEFISHYFDEEMSRSDVSEEYKMPPIFKYSQDYDNASMAEASTIGDTDGIELIGTGCFDPNVGTTVAGFKNGWKYSGSTEGGGLKFKVNANSLFIVYKQENSENVGSIDIFRDGKRVYTINANDPDGWYNPVAERVISNLDPMDMEIEIRMSEGYEDKDFEVLAIGFTQNEQFTYG